jgi:hypothetical protein
MQNEINAISPPIEGGNQTSSLCALCGRLSLRPLREAASAGRIERQHTRALGPRPPQ